VVDRGLADVDGGRLYFEREGDGPALLLTSGALDVRMWESQTEAMSRDYTFVRCDLRGYGRSSVPRTCPIGIATICVRSSTVSISIRCVSEGSRSAAPWPAIERERCSDWFEVVEPGGDDRVVPVQNGVEVAVSAGERPMRVGEGVGDLVLRHRHDSFDDQLQA
jgi:pimeloyl-ACP methyl ester carboxylesterase